MHRKHLTIAFSIAATLLLVTSAFAVPFASLSLPNSEITLGQTFTLEVIAQDVTDVDPDWGPDEIIAFGFDVVFNPAEFAYNGALVSAPFFDDSLLFPDTDVAGSAFPGVSGASFSLASLSFTALAAGDLSIGISSGLSDPNEGLNSWSYGPLDLTQSLNISVADDSGTPAPVPEPATVLLLATGLTGLGLFRTRKKA